MGHKSTVKTNIEPFNIARFQRFLVEKFGYANDARPELEYLPAVDELTAPYEEEELLALLKEYDPNGMYGRPAWQREAVALLDKETLTSEEQKKLDKAQRLVLRRALLEGPAYADSKTDK